MGHNLTMQQQLVSLSYAMEPCLDYLCAASFGLTALALRYTNVGNIILRSTILLRLATSLAAVVITVYLIEISIYVLYPSYSDHLEPTVASIAWLGMHGGVLYPDWATDVYGVLYGPVLYFFNGLFLLASPTLTMSKMPGIASLLIAFGILLSIVNKKTEMPLLHFL